jgi:hypothetical protein
MTHELDPQTFIESYGVTAEVMVGQGMRMTLGQALEAEQLFCPADKISRQDPDRRVRYLAHILGAAGTLRQEDAHLLEEKD